MPTRFSGTSLWPDRGLCPVQGSANYAWIGDPDINCFNDQSLAASVYRPGWSAGCFGAGADNAEDRANYGLYKFQLPTCRSERATQSRSIGIVCTPLSPRRRAMALSSSAPRFATRTNSTTPTTLLVHQQVDEAIPVAAHPEWNSNFTDPGYYDKTYHIGPVTDYSKVRAWVLANNIPL